MKKTKKTVVVEPQVIEELVEIEEVVKEEFFFPTKCRCPRCGSLDTISTSTQENIQYRVCRQPICKNRFKIVGNLV